MKYTTESLQELIEAPDYVSFIGTFLANYPKPAGRIGINKAEFSRKAGLKSRSFLGELLKRKKFPSKLTLSQIIKASRLPQNHKTLLRLLVYREHVAICPPSTKIADIEQLISQARESARVSLQLGDTTLVKAGHRSVFKVYASLGSVNTGATLDEVISRSRLTETEIQSCLKILMENRIVAEKEGRFFASSMGLDFEEKDQTPTIGRIIGHLGDYLKNSGDSLVSDRENMTYYSCFSIRRKNLDKFNAALREQVISLLDEYQEDDGDHVQEIFCCSLK